MGWLPKQLGLAPPATTRREVDAALATPLPVASAASVGFSAERLSRMDTAMQAEIDAGHYAGIGVMVARHGKLVKSRRYGYQSLEGRRPLREDATFRIASMTKPIIAVAMMTLYEEGKWQLDDPITKFLPELADLKVLENGKLVPLDRPMTLRHVMSTSAGFAFGPAMGSSNPRVDELYAAANLWAGTNDEMIAKLPSCRWKPNREPCFATACNRKSRARSSGASAARVSTPSSTSASSGRCA